MQALRIVGGGPGAREHGEGLLGERAVAGAERELHLGTLGQRPGQMRGLRRGMRAQQAERLVDARLRLTQPALLACRAGAAGQAERDVGRIAAGAADRQRLAPEPLRLGPMAERVFGRRQVVERRAELARAGRLGGLHAGQRFLHRCVRAGVVVRAQQAEGQVVEPDLHVAVRVAVEPARDRQRLAAQRDRLAGLARGGIGIGQCVQRIGQARRILVRCRTQRRDHRRQHRARVGDAVLLVVGPAQRDRRAGGLAVAGPARRAEQRHAARHVVDRAGRVAEREAVDAARHQQVGRQLAVGRLGRQQVGRLVQMPPGQCQIVAAAAAAAHQHQSAHALERIAGQGFALHG
ncbi:MAG: hypothetical protein NVV68_11170 [Dokdonella sp.]|nr:hypothetical protein [Dokdonella sp.]